MRSLLLRLLLGRDFAAMVRGYRPPVGEHNSLVTGSPTGWSWGKGDHGSELDGLGDDDHTQYLNTARHDVTARHPLGTVVPTDFPDLPGKSEVSTYNCPGWAWTQTATVGFATGRLVYIPIFVPKQTAYDYMLIDVLTAAAEDSLARLGIYEWDNGAPGALILDAGTVAIDAVAMKFIAITQTLNRGFYFLAYVGDGEPNLRTPAGGGGFLAPVHGQRHGAQGAMYYLCPFKDGQSGVVAGGFADPATAPDNRTNHTGVAIILRED